MKRIKSIQPTAMKFKQPTIVVDWRNWKSLIQGIKSDFTEQDKAIMEKYKYDLTRGTQEVEENRRTKLTTSSGITFDELFIHAAAKTARYHLPPQVFPIIHKFMRQLNVISQQHTNNAAFEELYNILGVGTNAKQLDQTFAALCRAKIGQYVGSKGSYLVDKGLCTRTRGGIKVTWAHETLIWLEETWDGVDMLLENTRRDNAAQISPGDLSTAEPWDHFIKQDHCHYDIHGIESTSNEITPFEAVSDDLVPSSSSEGVLLFESLNDTQSQKSGHCEPFSGEDSKWMKSALGSVFLYPTTEQLASWRWMNHLIDIYRQDGAWATIGIPQDI